MSILRTIVLGAAAFLMSGCEAGQEYPMPAAEATMLMANLAHNPAVSPMPEPLSLVTSSFEASPDGKSVQWLFIGNEGQDLGRIVATAEPSGERSTEVSVDYFKGTAPGGRWMTDQVRAQIEAHMPRLLTEAIDSTLERRPFDMALRGQVEEAIRAGLTATMFQGIHSELKRSIDETDAKQDQLDAERKARQDRPIPVRELPPPRDATRPTTDLSRFN